MLFLYSIIIYLLLPFIPLYLLKRSIKNKNYRLFWSERFSFNIKSYEKKPLIWIHSVSVGETRAISKIVQILQETYPYYKILITVMTPTGRDTANNIFKNVLIRYVPYDYSFAVKKFYKVFKPKIALIVETEIWPNLIFYARKFKVPIFLINARLSNKSYESYNKFKFFTNSIINNFNGIICQDNLTYNNFSKLGYKGLLETVGNIKFDLFYDKTNINNLIYLKSNILNKKIVTFFSTRIGEEEIIISNIPKDLDYLIIIIPRHPERFVEVENLLFKYKITYKKRSQNLPVDKETKVLLGDSMGEMLQYYYISDLAVVGGSFSNNGGQNLIEPIFLNKPVIFGSSMFNFKDIATNVINYNCAIKVNDMEECFNKIKFLLHNEKYYSNMVTNCQLFTNNYTGASYKIITIVHNFLNVSYET